MSKELNSAIYRTHAEREQTSAGASSLDHVRELHERAAKKWLELADRAERVERNARDR